MYYVKTLRKICRLNRIDITYNLSGLLGTLTNCNCHCRFIALFDSFAVCLLIRSQLIKLDLNEISHNITVIVIKYEESIIDAIFCTIRKVYTITVLIF